MAIPTNRTEFGEYCLRALGAPIIEINVTDDQVDDAIDYSLKLYADYHFDGSDKVYYKYPLTANNRPDRVYSLRVKTGGTRYSNSDVLVFSPTSSTPANGTITTDNSGSIIAATLTNAGQYYAIAPTVSITSSAGTGASIVSELAGFVPVPDNILGIVNIFDIGSSFSNVASIFNVRYQLVMNELFNLSNVSLIPYYMTMQHIELLEQLLVGKAPIRYNRHKGRLYLDMSWDNVTDGSFVVAEAYEVIDPNEFTSVWGDRWLATYCQERIKKVWGGNLKKFSGMAMPGGVQFNGQSIYDEATAKIYELEHELIRNYSIPPLDMIG